MSRKLTATFVSLFPQSTYSYVEASILGRAVQNGILEIRECQIRDFAQNKHQTVDDSLCGGGAGQLLKVDVVVRAIRAAKIPGVKEKIILLAPKGKIFKQAQAEQLANYDHLIFVCGRYEGIDSRIENYVDKICSIGDFVLTGGELPAMVMLDAIAREIEGVLGNTSSKEGESFKNGLLEHNQYTRPIEFEGHKVPDILLSGHHEKISRAREVEQKNLTKKLRPNLLD